MSSSGRRRVRGPCLGGAGGEALEAEHHGALDVLVVADLTSTPTPRAAAIGRWGCARVAVSCCWAASSAGRLRTERLAQSRPRSSSRARRGCGWWRSCRGVPGWVVGLGGRGQGGHPGRDQVAADVEGRRPSISRTRWPTSGRWARTSPRSGRECRRPGAGGSGGGSSQQPLRGRKGRRFGRVPGRWPGAAYEKLGLWVHDRVTRSCSTVVFGRGAKRLSPKSSVTTPPRRHH